MRLLACTAALLGIGLLAILPAPLRAQPTDDPAALATALNDAINAGDLDAAMALFHEDAVYETPSCPAGGCVGAAAIREILATFIADQLEITPLGDWEVQGDTVRGASASTSVGLRAAGVDRIIVVVIGDLRDGRFERWRVIPDLNDPQTATLFAPGPPATGNGGLADRGGPTRALPLALIALGVAAGPALLIARRRRTEPPPARL